MIITLLDFVYSIHNSISLSPDLMHTAVYKRCINIQPRYFSTSLIRRSDSLPFTIRQVLEHASKNVNVESKKPEIAVHGWIKSVRRQKHVAFAQLSDGTDLNSRGLQVVFDDPTLADQSVIISSRRSC